MDGGGGGEGGAVEVEGERGEGHAVAGEGSVSEWHATHAIAMCQSLNLPVKSEVVYLPLIWYGRLLTALNTWGRSEPVDVGLRGRMAREGPCAMVLPKRNGPTPSTACNAMGNSSRW